MTISSDVPTGWQVVRLGDLVSTFGGLTGKTKKDFGAGEARYVTFLDVVTNIRLTGDDLDWVDVAPDERQHGVHRGDILLNGSSETPEEVALAAVVDFDPGERTFVNSFCFGLRPRLGAQIDPVFLAYYLRGPSGRSDVAPLAQGATRYNIAKTKLLALGMALPPLNEQQAIAAALRDVDALTESLREAIGKKQDVRTGIVQQLLSGCSRLPGFGAEWTRATLGALGTLLKGRGVKRSDVLDSGAPCIRYGEIYTTFGDYTDHTASFVSPEVAATALPLETGDLLFAGSGETRDEIGMCVAYTGEQPAVAGGDIVVLRGHGANPVFLAALMNSPEVVKQKSRAGQGDAVVHIYARALAEIEIDLPSREEQDAIAEVIVSADREIEALKRRLEKTLQIGEGMMRELLTGRTRLPVAEVAA